MSREKKGLLSDVVLLIDTQTLANTKKGEKKEENGG